MAPLRIHAALHAPLLAGLIIAIVSLGPPTAVADPAPPPDGGDLLRIPGLPPLQMPPGVHVYKPSPQDRDADPEADTRALDRDFGDRIMPNRQGNGLGDYGSTVIGPGGVIKPTVPRTEPPKKKPPTPAERAEAIRKALAPKPPLAMARRRTLDDLYAKLAVATDEDEAKGLAGLIGTIWMRSGSDTANLLMQRAAQSIERKDYPLALSLLDRIVALKPDWAEAWNKRASARFFAGDLDGSMADVEHVLKLEPKHFGALEGLATILEHTGFDKRALEVYRRALATYPHQPEVQKEIDKLTIEVEGQGI